MSGLSALDRSDLAKKQGIRSGVEKTMAAVLAAAFRAKRRMDLSSGDIPKCFSGEVPYPSINAAFRSMPPEYVAYDHPLYTEAQHLIAKRFGLSDSRLENEACRAQLIPGISPYMPPMVRIFSRILMGNRPGSPKFIIVPPTHPNWISAIVAEHGYDSIVTIKRDARGYPDLEDAKRVFSTIDRPFVLIVVPDDNPGGVCTPNSIYFNVEGTGLFNLVRNAQYYGGVIFDSIYSDFSWGEHANQRESLREAARELNLRMAEVWSMSKIYGLPGLRVGFNFYHGPLDDRGLEFCSSFITHANDGIKGGVSAPAAQALVSAFSGDAEIEVQRLALLERVKGRVQCADGLFRGAGLTHVLGIPEIDTAFYGLYGFADQEHDRTAIPWLNPLYRESLIRTIGDRLGSSGVLAKVENMILWNAFAEDCRTFGLSASRALALELALNGVGTLPHDPFYPKFENDDLTPYPGLPKASDGREEIAIRFILAHPEQVTRDALEVVKRVWDEGISAIRSGGPEKAAERYR